MHLNLNKFNELSFKLVAFISLPLLVVIRLFYYQGIINIPSIFSAIYLVKILFSFFATIYIVKNRCFNRKWMILCSVVFVTFAFKLTYNFDMYGHTRGDYKSAFEYNLPYLVDYVFYFSLGCYLSIYNPISERFRYWIIFFLFSIIIVNIDFSMLRININSFVSPDFHSSYIWFSDMIVLTTIIYMVGEGKSSNNFYILIFLWVLSFFLISRTVFILLGLMVFLNLSLKILYSYNKRKLTLLFFIFLFLCMFFYYFYGVSIIEGSGGLDLSNNRIYKLYLYGLSSDSSMNERQLMFLSGINDIANNPLLGSFGGQLSINTDYWHEPRWGAFIHNIFSYYRQFGLVPFLAINILVLMGVFSLYKFEKFGLLFFGFVFFAIELYVFRSFTSPYVYVFIGYVSNKRIVGSG
ncbi:hypothetical protein P7M17_03345 [Vibrio parahaemolyticus]|nr:hypothetical protein [Vibrio parahaemolyticus]